MDLFFGNHKTRRTHTLGKGWGNADCLKSKAELPFKGGLAFLLGKGGDYG
jgi:hypothetical protein